MNEGLCGADYLESAVMANKELINKINRLQREVKHCRNELCLKCGRYHHSYAGSCDNCRFRHGGEWEADLE